MGERVGDIAIEHLRLGPHGDAYADALALRAALTQSAEQVARLERTVERMTEKVAEWRLRIREVARGSVELEALDDVSAAMLAASSPYHAGAPPTLTPYTLGRGEAGEGDK